ncbi:TPA: sugar ABC transporter substrate-binding protein, partial [Streptococcus suis]
TSAYSKLADGTFFATMSTPDVYSTFLDELIQYYEHQVMSTIEAETLASENLVMVNLPQLPKSGDLTDVNSELIDTKTMGGVNGYAISAYTPCPNASLAFVNFATNYENI